MSSSEHILPYLTALDVTADIVWLTRDFAGRKWLCDEMVTWVRGAHKPFL
jgi:hypothetical protein